MKYEWEAGGYEKAAGDGRAPGLSDLALAIATSAGGANRFFYAGMGGCAAGDWSGPPSP
jgi:hypothetical protein